MTEEIAVYKLQEWDMGNGEKKYSQLGSLEAHYYFAKNNGGKVLFTTKDLYQRNVSYLLLTLPNGEYGFLSKIIVNVKHSVEAEDLKKLINLKNSIRSNVNVKNVIFNFFDILQNS